MLISKNSVEEENFCLGSVRKNSLIRDKLTNFLGALLGNEDLKKWKHLNTFILNWTEKDNCGKVTVIYDEAKGR